MITPLEVMKKLLRISEPANNEWWDNYFDILCKCAVHTNIERKKNDIFYTPNILWTKSYDQSVKGTFRGL